MPDLDNNFPVIDNNESFGPNDLEKEFGFDDELSKEFETEVKKMKEQATLSEDLSGYAKGFPDWDLLPPDEK